jgi:SAM-dependent methyltransferase
MTALDAKKSADIELQKVIYIAQNNSELNNLRATILDSFENFETALNWIKQQTYEQIKNEERPYVEDSYQRYEQSRQQSHRYERFKKPNPNISPEVAEQNIQIYVDSIMNNRLPLSPQSQEFIMNRITRSSSWQNTTMILHPGMGPWIHKMGDNDPIYLVDEKYELLSPVLSQFNEVHRRKFRTYTIQEDRDQDIFWQLPDNQFGLVLAWNYFNHKPFEVIRRYLTELYKKMRPGGKLLMTYNDCDRWEGVKAVEAKVALYTPGSLIQDFAKSLGFEQTFVYHDNSPWTWAEFRKPGEWQSCRGGQTVATITTKPEVAELYRLRSLAREFGMATPEVIVQYNKEQLVKLIIKNGKENLL